MDRSDRIKRDHYSDLWCLSNLEPLTQTETSNLYLANFQGKKSVLKIYSEKGCQFEAEGPDFLQACDGQSAIKVYHYDPYACLIEYVDGPELKTLVDSDRDEEATKILGTIVKNIHHKMKKVSKEEGQNFFIDYVKPLTDEAHRNDAKDIIKTTASYAQQILEENGDYQYLHGDVHHENIMLSRERGWLLIDPKNIVGPKEYDLANCFINPLDYHLTRDVKVIKRRVDQLSKITGYDEKKILMIACIRATLSSTWTKNNSGQHVENRLKTAEIISETFL
ncbi:MAG: aminoglycoside phosphotransferase family protein [Pseudomonadota bacterium]